jgi:serine/threonine protein kinase
MWLRKELYQALYDMIAKRQIALSAHDEESADALSEAIDVLRGDLRRLQHAPPSEDLYEELHLRFLARCRLLHLGEFTITGYIGAGQCGVVYRAMSMNDPSQVAALKLLYFPRNQEEAFRFEQEGNVLFNLDNPVIVKGLLPTQSVDYIPVLWYPMELILGAVTLDVYYRTSNLKNTIKMVAEACGGLAYAHQQGIVHRDLHLKNILVLKSGAPKILDFGSAKYQDESLTFRPVGGLRCSSPEKLDNPNLVDGKSDVFSIGCILYFVVAGKWPFFGDTFGDLLRNLSSAKFVRLEKDAYGLSDCIHLCLQHDPNLRPDAELLRYTLLSISNRM